MSPSQSQPGCVPAATTSGAEPSAAHAPDCQSHIVSVRGVPDDCTCGASESPVREAIWRCFQCDEVFVTREFAEAHFGRFEDCVPACKIGAERFRDMENQLAMWRNESDPSSRAFYELGAKHAGEKRREEEAGYERGLRDAGHEAERAETAEALVAELRDVLNRLTGSSKGVRSALAEDGVTSETFDACIAAAEAKLAKALGREAASPEGGPIQTLDDPIPPSTQPDGDDR